jgi:serine protease Do
MKMLLRLKRNQALCSAGCRTSGPVDAKELKALDLANGVKISGLNNGKLARYTDVREGFIVTKINDKPVKSVKEFNEVMKSKKAGDLVILTGTYADLPREFNYAFRM